MQFVDDGIVVARHFLKTPHAISKEIRLRFKKNANNRLPRDESNIISREQLISLLNDDIAREYQAIISYVIYSQVLK